MKFCGQVANKSADKFLVGLRTINLAFADKICPQLCGQIMQIQ
jgi:hypothetical protein